MIYYILLLLLITACGTEDKHNKDCILDGVDCHADEEDSDNEGDSSDNRLPDKDWTGPRGDIGPRGDTGDRGDAGSHCTVIQGIGSAEIRCEDGTSATIRDGNNGNDGSDGAPGDDAEIGVVDPCDDHPTKTDQIFFVIHNKVFTTSIKSGKPYISQVLPGSYITVDGTNCPYTVDQDGLIAF